MGLFKVNKEYRVRMQELGRSVRETGSIEIPASEYRCILSSSARMLVIEEECSGIDYMMPMTKIGKAMKRGDCVYLDFGLFTAVQANRVFKPMPMAAMKKAPVGKGKYGISYGGDG